MLTANTKATKGAASKQPKNGVTSYPAIHALLRAETLFCPYGGFPQRAPTALM